MHHHSRVHPRSRRITRLGCAILSLLALARAGATGPRTFDLTKLTPADTYATERGFGFDLGTSPASDASRPFYVSVAEPEGNYRVTLTFGDAHAASETTVKAESRQLMLERVTTPPGEFVTRSFVVNVRTPHLPAPPANAPGGTTVVLNPREAGLLRWDEKLTLEFDGPAPRVRSIAIEPARVPTVFLAGDSTVTDQPYEPTASWGQMLPRFLQPGVAVANHAESGETLKSFLAELRLAKILSQIQPGDYLFIQFGHNDEKRSWPQTYVEAHTTYRDYLRAYIDEARLHGATPVLVTSMQRRTFDAAGRITNTHGDYPEVVRALAREEHVALVDLDRISTAFYEALGPARAPLAFNAGGRDGTHHDNYGAYELAQGVVQAIRDSGLPLAREITSDFAGFDPAHPDSPDTFALPASPLRRDDVIRGN
jgi:lysophospholipase L1-like esterase